MYLEPTIQRNRRRRSSPLRIAILIALIILGLDIYAHIEQGNHDDRTFVPAPTPTFTACVGFSPSHRLGMRYSVMKYKLAVFRARPSKSSMPIVSVNGWPLSCRSR